MRIHFRRLDNNEPDYELAFGVLAAPLFLVLVVLLALFPEQWAPICLFHRLAGIPCPGCGALRSVRVLLAGRFWDAWTLQPLAVSACFGMLLYAIYSAIAVIGRLPRLRMGTLSRREWWFVVYASAFLLLVNWLYLILDGR